MSSLDDVTMPPDFARQLTYHRDRTYRHALNTACTTCKAPAGEPCTTTTRPSALTGKPYDIHPGDTGLHPRRLDHGPTVIHPTDRLEWRPERDFRCLLKHQKHIIWLMQR